MRATTMVLRLGWSGSALNVGFYTAPIQKKTPEDGVHGFREFLPNIATTSTPILDEPMGVPLHIDFRKVNAATFREFNLHPNGRALRLSGNISDSSLLSETYSAHVMGCVFSRMGYVSEIRNSELNIRYRARCKKTDYIMKLDRKLYGVEIVAVEVKRLSSFGGKNQLDKEYIINLLSKANDGAIESNRCVHPSDRWHTQILHVITDEMSVISDVAAWCSQVENPGISGVFLTCIQGNARIIMGC